MSADEFQLDRVRPGSRLANDVGLVQQVMSADLVVREDRRARGVRCVLLQNDLVSLEVLVDRGLDIGRTPIEQTPVAWASPVGIVAPSLLEPSTALTVASPDRLSFPTLQPGEARELGVSIELLRLAAAQ